MLNCVIIDDESFAIDVLLNYINRTSSLNLLYSTVDPADGYSYIQENSNKIDLVFLDIEMKGLSGTSLIKLIPNKITTIFTTAYDKYAIEAFELGAKDYLMKPISYEKFLLSINRLTQGNNSIQKQDYFFINVDKKITKINISDVIHVAGNQNFLGITCKNNVFYMCSNTFGEIQQYLTEPNFVRINKSHIIAFSSILFVEGNEVHIIIDKSKDGISKNIQKALPIGITYRKTFLSLINRI